MAKQFESADDFRHWQQVYGIFNSPDGQEVLRDLVVYCGLFDDTFPLDSYERAARDGRRHVIIRILRNINLTTEELFRVYKGQFVDRRDVK